MALSCCLIPAAAQETEHLTIDAKAATTPFPHFWEQSFGSGRAILSLRESYRQDIDTVKNATGFTGLRFHGIFNDEVGLYDPDRMTKNPGLAAEKANDASQYNFSYVDQIYDGLLQHGVKPFVEMSFMPAKLAADPHLTQPFFYKPISSPPADYAKWGAMVQAFAEHLIARYGVDEVATWKFEVWNEPNLDFWGGEPKQATYWQLYDAAAHAIKAASPRLQVGGPATAQAAWVPEFLAHIKQTGAPADFVSTHVYANDTAPNVLHTQENIARDEMVYRAVKMVHEQIAASAFPKIPLIFSEYNASYANEPDVTDTPYMGPWLANNIRQCDGLTVGMYLWDFSDVFEEQGVVRTPFYGGFGLVAADHIPKASLNIVRALHQLGTERLPLDSHSALATRNADGKLVLALWDYSAPDGEGDKYTAPPSSRTSRSFDLTLQHVPSNAQVSVLRIDDNHGNAVKAFDAMGRPAGDLTPQQVKQLQAAGAMAPAEHTRLQGGHLTISVPQHGLAVLIVGQ